MQRRRRKLGSGRQSKKKRGEDGRSNRLWRSMKRYLEEQKSLINRKPSSKANRLPTHNWNISIKNAISLQRRMDPILKRAPTMGDSGTTSTRRGRRCSRRASAPSSPRRRRPRAKRPRRRGTLASRPSSTFLATARWGHHITPKRSLIHSQTI